MGSPERPLHLCQSIPGREDKKRRWRRRLGVDQVEDARSQIKAVPDRCSLHVHHCSRARSRLPAPGFSPSPGMGTRTTALYQRMQIAGCSPLPPMHQRRRASDGDALVKEVIETRGKPFNKTPQPQGNYSNSPIYYLIKPKPIQPTMQVKSVVPSPESIWVRCKSFKPFESNPLAE